MARRTYQQVFLTLMAFSLTGCGFFLPPDEPPTPSTGTQTMLCGETRSVDGLSGADAIPLDIPLLSNFEILPDFEPEELGMRLTHVTESSIERSLELWDPYRNLRLIPGIRDVEGDLNLELLGTTSLFGGSITLNCDQPAENCFNLVDDDGDGFVDCADLNCAQNESCQTDQTDFETLHLPCSEEPLEVSTSLAATDDQHTLYQTYPGGGDQPELEFWGGAEVVIRSVDTELTNIDITLNNPALVCIALDDTALDAEVVVCEDWGWFEAGDSLTADPTELPIFIEPLGSGFDSLSLSVDCGAP